MAFCDGCIDQMLTFPTINATLRLSIPYEYRIYGYLYFIMILTLTFIHELIFYFIWRRFIIFNLINRQMSSSQTQNKSTLNQSKIPSIYRQLLKIETRSLVQSKTIDKVDDVKVEILENSRSEVHEKYNKYPQVFVKKSSQRPSNSDELPIGVSASKIQQKNINSNESSEKSKKKKSSSNQSNESSVYRRQLQEMDKRNKQLQKKLKQSQEQRKKEKQTLQQKIDRLQKGSQKMKEQFEKKLTQSLSQLTNGNGNQAIKLMLDCSKILPPQGQEKLNHSLEQIQNSSTNSTWSLKQWLIFIALAIIIGLVIFNLEGKFVQWIVNSVQAIIKKYLTKGVPEYILNLFRKVQTKVL